MSGPFGSGGLNFFSGETAFYPYLLERSLRFNDDSSSHLTRTPTSDGNLDNWTFSAWVKLGNDVGRFLIGASIASNKWFHIAVNSSSKIDVRQFNVSGYDFRKISDRLLRDKSAWYHLVVSYDSDDSTAEDRIKVYLNGERVTNFGTNQNPSSGTNSFLNQNHTHTIGAFVNDNGSSISSFFDGYLAEVNLVDGTTLQPTDFGETKEGIWIAKKYTGSYGTNGFYLNFKDDSTVEGFNTVAYTGPIGASAAAGTTGIVTGVGFQPDFIWIKNRTNANNHQLFDSVRGIDSSGDQALHSNLTSGQSTSNTNGGLSSIDADGFTLKAGTDGGSDPSNTTRSILVGGDNHNYVSWIWKAGGAPTATNSAGAGATPTAGSVKIDGSNLGSALAGTIPATKISANTTYGFSIVTYTGTGSAGTIAHGLGAVPKWIMVKKTSGSQAWQVYHVGNTVDENGATVSPEDEKLTLNTTAHTVTDSTTWNDTAPTSTVFSVGSGNGTNQLNQTYVAYLWCEKSGYSKFDSYTGNGSSTGPTVTTGFKPAFVITKSTEEAHSWFIADNTRNTSNPVNKWLFSDLSNTENDSSDRADFLSSGFQITNANDNQNKSGKNYIYMAFADTRDFAFWTDDSGNENDWQPNNLKNTDVVPDSPTNNFATLNPLQSPASAITGSISYRHGNLFIPTGNRCHVRSTISVSSGKWYYEFRLNSIGNSVNAVAGVVNADLSATASYNTEAIFYRGSDGNKLVNNTASSFGASYTNGDIIGVALDIDGDDVEFFKNNVTQGTIALSGISGVTTWQPIIGFQSSDNASSGGVNFGQDSSFQGLEIPQGNTDDNSIGDFFYAPPTGYLALCTDNLPDPEVDPNTGDNPEDYFNTVLYTGNNTTDTAITGVGFAPDWIWIKDRLTSNNHILVDRVRGVDKLVYSNGNSVAEIDGAAQIASLDSDGFTLGAAKTYVNESGSIYVAWNWKAGGTPSTNTDGTVTTNVSANQEAGFSVFTYTGTGSSCSVGHGLGTTPKMVWYKNRDTASNWLSLTTAIDGTTDYVSISSNAAKTNLDSYSITSSVINIGGASTAVNTSGQEHVAFAFAEKDGYSKIGKFVGAGGADNTFVYLGFRPAWFLIKRVDTTGDWVLYDNKRDPFNVGSDRLSPNLADGRLDGASNYGIDFVSNGVKFRSGQADTAVSGGTYIYMAFAEQPFKYSNAR
tara:strand:- start:631 stop:4218 length:3588 start_codon:yes stop_codon:yes gene_type:complete